MFSEHLSDVFFTCEIKKTVTNWNRKCFWTSVVYILWNGLYIEYILGGGVCYFNNKTETHKNIKLHLLLMQSFLF